MQSTIQEKQARRLILLGLILFLCGLATGLAVQQMKNPRMALAAHMEGLMNGMFLMVIGLIWNKLVLSKGWLNTIFWLALYGTFANLAAVLISAMTGAGKMMPLAGGQDGKNGTETLITILLISLSLAMLLVTIVIITGFYRYMQRNKAEADPGTR